MKLLPSFRLVGIAGAVGLILGGLGAWRVTSWANAAHEAAAVKASAQAEREALEDVIETLHTQIADAAAALQGYKDEIKMLRGRSFAAPVADVRLCKRAPVSAGAVPAASGPAVRLDDSAAAPGLLPIGDGQNVAPDFYRHADEADDVSARLRALQDWANRISRSGDPSNRPSSSRATDHPPAATTPTN